MASSRLSLCLSFSKFLSPLSLESSPFSLDFFPLFSKMNGECRMLGEEGGSHSGRGFGRCDEGGGVFPFIATLVEQPPSPTPFTSMGFSMDGRWVVVEGVIDVKGVHLLFATLGQNRTSLPHRIHAAEMKDLTRCLFDGMGEIIRKRRITTLGELYTLFMPKSRTITGNPLTPLVPLSYFPLLPSLIFVFINVAH